MKRIISLAVIGLMLFAASCSSQAPATTEAPVVTEAPLDAEAIKEIKKLAGEMLTNTKAEMELAAQTRFAPENAFPYDADIFAKARLEEESTNALNEQVAAFRQQFEQEGTLDRSTLLEFFELVPYVLIGITGGDVLSAERAFLLLFGQDSSLYDEQSAWEGMRPTITGFAGRELTSFIATIVRGREEDLTTFITARALMGGQKVSGDIAGLASALATAESDLMNTFIDLMETIDLSTPEGQSKLRLFIGTTRLGDFEVTFETYVEP
jgi:hypothetical protein